MFIKKEKMALMQFQARFLGPNGQNSIHRQRVWQITKHERCWPQVAKQKNEEKGCEMRGGGGLLYSPKASSPFILPKLT